MYESHNLLSFHGDILSIISAIIIVDQGHMFNLAVEVNTSRSWRGEKNTTLLFAIAELLVVVIITKFAGITQIHSLGPRLSLQSLFPYV